MSGKPTPHSNKAALGGFGMNTAVSAQFGTISMGHFPWIMQDFDHCFEHCCCTLRIKGGGYVGQIYTDVWCPALDPSRNALMLAKISEPCALHWECLTHWSCPIDITCHFIPDVSQGVTENSFLMLIWPEIPYFFISPVSQLSDVHNSE